MSRGELSENIRGEQDLQNLKFFHKPRQSYTPTVTGATGLTVANVDIRLAVYERITADLMFVALHVRFTASGTNQQTVSISLPAVAGASVYIGGIFCLDDITTPVTYLPGLGGISAGGASIACYQCGVIDTAPGISKNWTADANATTKMIQGDFIYITNPI